MASLFVAVTQCSLFQEHDNVQTSYRAIAHNIKDYLWIINIWRCTNNLVVVLVTQKHLSKTIVVAYMLCYFARLHKYIIYLHGLER